MQKSIAFESLRARLISGLSLLHARGVIIIALGCASGIIAAVLVMATSWVVRYLHRVLFGVPEGIRLSAVNSLSSPLEALVPVAGGIVVGLSIAYLRRWRYRPPIDPIEANALYGGRLFLTDSAIVGFQTIVSSGFGASVGLEAAFTQMGAGIASRIGQLCGLRRGDLRILVGCGAGGAIAAAFGAPLTGAFYAFEIIIGVYSVGNVAPVLAAAVSASLTADYLGAVQIPIDLGPLPPLTAEQYLPFLLLGLLSGAISILTMTLVTKIEEMFKKLAVDAKLRPAMGGVMVGVLGLLTPQVLSSGHGALHRELMMNAGLQMLTTLFVLKLIASAVSIGSGFRGGLFFTSLFLGSLLGKIFAEVMSVVWPQAGIDPLIAGMVGMTSLAVGVVGGPLTMTFLALESSGSLALTGVVLGASIVSAVLVRETFGYSFSTWRFHLRGETIRSAHDVGRMRNLTVGSMMRKDIPTVPGDMTVAEFRSEVPLGSAQRIIATEANNAYAGMLVVAEIHALDPETSDALPVRTQAKFKNALLTPMMNVKSAADLFTRTGAEELAVVHDYKSRRVMGLLTEGHLLRRYSEELEKTQQDLSGQR